MAMIPADVSLHMYHQAPRALAFGTWFFFSTKREWDRNRSFVRIRFRRPTSAQLSRAIKADESSVVEPIQPLRLARQCKGWDFCPSLFSI